MVQCRWDKRKEFVACSKDKSNAVANSSSIEMKKGKEKSANGIILKEECLCISLQYRLLYVS
jgi:hypothetical protein